jgi:hypothetical protein
MVLRLQIHDQPSATSAATDPKFERYLLENTDWDDIHNTVKRWQTSGTKDFVVYVKFQLTPLLPLHATPAAVSI